MKHFFTLLNHEVRMLLVSPGTYVAATAFLGFMGFIFIGIVEGYNSAPRDISPAIVFFRFFFFPVLFTVPLLTMKCLAEERRHGTLETLLTTPVTTTEVVLSKYGAAYLLYFALWASTIGFFYVLKKFSGDARFIDPGPLVGGYLFIAISGMLFVAIGVFASSFTRNQAVAGIVCFVALVLLIGGVNYLSEASWLEGSNLRALKQWATGASVLTHRDDFTRGIIDTRHLLFYLSGTTLALIFSILGVEAKLLHS